MLDNDSSEICEHVLKNAVLTAGEKAAAKHQFSLVVKDDIYIYSYLVPETTSFKWMFGETTISYRKIWNRPIETTIYKQMFQVPAKTIVSL